MTQHVVTRWQAFIAGPSGPFRTSCGVSGWTGAGKHDPLCATCAQHNGLTAGDRGVEIGRSGSWTQ